MSARDAKRAKRKPLRVRKFVRSMRRVFRLYYGVLFGMADPPISQVLYQSPWVELPKGGLKRCSTRGKRGW